MTPSDPAPPTLDLSVLVVNYRTWEDTAGLVRALWSELDSARSEILVVNNCRRTHPPEGMETRDVRFVESVRNVGFAGGVNLGAACARGRYLLVLNPDVRPQPGAIRELLAAAARHPRAAVFLPRLLDESGAEQCSVRTFYTLETILAARTPWGRTERGKRILARHLGHGMDRSREQTVDWGLGAAMLLEPSRIPHERGRIMDERFFLYMEDVDLCLRAWKAGAEVQYVPQAGFTHQHRRESGLRPLSLANGHHLLSLFRFVRKHGFLPQRP